jgi:hypothetical protein
VLYYCYWRHISTIRDDDYRSIALSIFGLNPFLFISNSRQKRYFGFAWIILAFSACKKTASLSRHFFWLLGAQQNHLPGFLFRFSLCIFSKADPGKKRKQIIYQAIAIFGLVFGVLVLPWIIDDSRAFLGDVIGFQSGMSARIALFPGWFSMLLLKLGVFSSPWPIFPFLSYNFL